MTLQSEPKLESNPMTDQIREQMSALIDGQLPRDQVDLLVRRMARDAELKRAFGNYVLAGEVLRAPGGVLASPGFAAKVSAAIRSDESSARSGLRRSTAARSRCARDAPVIGWPSRRPGRPTASPRA